MVGISRQTDYAARIVLHLACLEPGTQVALAGIARQRLLPAPFVRRLVGRLVDAGILQSSRGFKGGVRLGRPAEAISMLDVVMAMEGEVALNACVDHLDSCPFSAHCPVQRAWTDVTQVLRDHLAAIRFDQLASGTADHVRSHRAGPRPGP
jgi:Rrf2 family protein